MVKEFEQSGYYALVLGGSSGLGLAAALKLAQHGMGIVVIHRNTRSEMEEINKGFDKIKETGVPFTAMNLDLTAPGAQQQVFRFLSKGTDKCRCLLHSIAKGSLRPMSDERAALTTDDLMLTMNYMAFSLYEWVAAMHKASLFAMDARVLAFTSEGSSKAWKHYAAVSAAKAALEALMRSIALEFAPYGIKANCVQAGITLTRSFRQIPGNEELEKHSLMRNPFGRLTTPEDVASVVYLLCRDEAAWINGSVIPVDGGEHIC